MTVRFIQSGGGVGVDGGDLTSPRESLPLPNNNRKRFPRRKLQVGSITYT